MLKYRNLILFFAFLMMSAMQSTQAASNTKNLLINVSSI